PISGYVVDFVCLGARLVIEVDGSQHGAEVAADAKRTRVLNLNGFRVLRFWNNAVFEDLQGVLTEILLHLPAPPSPVALRAPTSPASGRGDKASRNADKLRSPASPANPRGEKKQKQSRHATRVEFSRQRAT